MKWFFGLILTLIMPCMLMAETVNVGVNVTDIPALDVVVTLNADIDVNVKNKAVSFAGLTVKNKSDAAINVAVTDIEVLSEGAPSEFVEIGQQLLYDANEVETASKIAFGISKNGVDWATIYPESENKPIELGVIAGNDGWLPSEFPVYSENAAPLTSLPGDVEYYEFFQNSEIGISPYFTKTYLLTAEVGWKWTTEQSLEYAITVVVSFDDIEANELQGNSSDLIGAYIAEPSFIYGIYVPNDEGGITNELDTLILTYEIAGDTRNYNFASANLLPNYYNYEINYPGFYGDGSDTPVLTATTVHVFYEANTPITTPSGTASYGTDKDFYYIEIPITEEYKATLDKEKDYLFRTTIEFYNCPTEGVYSEECTIVDTLGEIYSISGYSLLGE